MVFLLQSVYLDIPTMAGAVWTIVLYHRCLETGGGPRQVIPLALLAVVTLYTYQLAIYWLTPLAAHALVMHLSGQRSLRGMWTGATVFVVLMLPLAVFTVTTATDNLGAAVGQTPLGLDTLVPVAHIASVDYWTYYVRLLWTYFPAQCIGGVVLFALALRPGLHKPPLWGYFALVVIVAYLGFSLIPSKTLRYSSYIAVLATPAVIHGVTLVMTGLLGRRGRAAGWIPVATLTVAIAFSIFQAVSLVAVEPTYLTGMDRVAKAITESRPNARVLYSGALDASFVLYMRQADPGRRTYTFRAGVQTEEPAAVAQFIAEQECVFRTILNTDSRGT